MFSHLEAIDDLADFRANLGGAQVFFRSTFDLFADFLKHLFGRVQEFTSLTFSFLRANFRAAEPPVESCDWGLVSIYMGTRISYI